MARLAATEHGADWVMSSDADEFWWPRGGSLPRCSARSRAATGSSQSFVRHFVPVPADDGPFRGADDAAARRAGAGQRPAQPVAPVPQGRPPAPSRAPRSSRAATRSAAPASCRCAAGTRSRCSTSRSARPRSSSARARSGARAVEKFYAVARRSSPGPGPPTTRSRSRTASSGRSAGVFDELVGDGAKRARRARGRLPRRGHAAPRRAAPSRGYGEPPAFPRPTAADDAAFAVDAAVLGEADLVRVRRRLDELAPRVGSARGRVRRRLESAAASLAARRLGERLMRVAMTLARPDEADLVDTWLRYHLARGVDVVLVTDHRLDRRDVGRSPRARARRRASSSSARRQRCSARRNG